MEQQNDDERLIIKVSNDMGSMIRVGGELDFYNRGKLMLVVDSFFAQEQNKFVLDLSNVSYMDSSGLSSLVLIKRLVENRGGIMPCVFGKSVKRIIALSGLENFFQVFNSADGAKKALASSTA